MKHHATHFFPTTTGLVPRLRLALLPGLLAAGLASCGGQQAADTPANPATGPAPVAADSLQPTPAPADATATDTARPKAVVPLKPAAKPKAAVQPAAAPVAAEVAGPAEPAASEAAVPAPAPEPVAPAAPTTRTQAGRVLDESGRPLVGATVLLKGSSKGTTTDASGNYSLEVPATDNTFLIGYGGYEDETASAHDGQPLNVTLLPKAKSRRK